MENKKVRQYATEIPREMKDTIKALDDDTRLAILIALMKNGRMTFTDLKKTFEINSSSLSHHLTLLQNGGLVDNSLEISKKESHSYYNTTDITKPVLKSLLDIIGSVPNLDDSHSLSRLNDDIMKSLNENMAHSLTAANEMASNISKINMDIGKPNEFQSVFSDNNTKNSDRKNRRNKH
jgi:DNA-binding transcriptional ArsR family regulator